MAARPVALSDLTGRLLALLAQKRTSLALVELDGTQDAFCHYDTKGGKLTRLAIHVDQDRAALVEGTVHELLHAHLELDAIFAPELEEAVISALEREVVHHVKQRPRLLASWRRAIQRKLDEAEKTS